MSSGKYQPTIEAMKIEIEKVIEKENICGLAIALVDKQGIIWSKGFGFTDITGEEKVTADTLFSTQSMGKTTTATAFMVLASKGLIDLDDTIRKYYPDFSIKTKFGDPEEEVKKITFRKLLGHIAGLTHEAPIGGNYNYTKCSFEEHVASINDTWLRSKVGTEFAYSNLGFDLVAYVLGKIKKKSFPEVVQEELFKPLETKNATMNIEQAMKHSFAKGHIGDFQTPSVQIPMLGAGGVYISVNEQAKFLMLHLNKGKVNNKQLIKPELFREMYSTPFVTDKKEILFGLGLYQEQPIGETKVWAHGGGGYGYLTYNAWIPEQGIGAIVFTNGMHHSGQNVKLVRKALELMVEDNKELESIEIAEEKLQRLVGTYYTIRTPIHNVQLEDRKLIVFTT
jgi:CubicO group peptidase (beta-lactamase class C family)